MGNIPARPVPVAALKYLNRSALVFLFDLCCGLLAWSCAFVLRFSFDSIQVHPDLFWGVAAWMVPLHALACRVAGLYRGLWAFASLPDLKRLLKAIAASTVGLGAFSFVVGSSEPLVLSLLLLYPMFLLVFMGGGRALYRIWKEDTLYREALGAGKPVIVVGAGRTAAMLVRELAKSPDWRVVGLLDDDQGKWGREIGGFRVMGPIAMLEHVAKASRAHHAVVAVHPDQRTIHSVVTSLAVQAGVQVLTIPRIEDVMANAVTVSNLRKVEIEDLLGREPVWIETQYVSAMLEGRVVLVTGAGGSIGSELCRQLARFRPEAVVLFEQSEFALYKVSQWFEDNFPGVAFYPIVGDVKDRDRVYDVFRRFSPEVVFHAAAYKHVPLMEVGNAWQAVRNNVLGTHVLCCAAKDFGVDRFVMISTDKAVNPTNVMGASKRLAEMVCQAMQASAAKTHFVMVRFGNVLGSTGSVIPRFEEQIARGGPVTVTHPEVTRYFMSIHEAAQLVLQAATMGQGGEIFVLEMGKPVRIDDLARNMIRLSGYSEDDIRIEYTGLRPGEKLYEELLSGHELTLETPHPKLRVARASPVRMDLLNRILSWLGQGGVVTDAEVRLMLAQWIPEYSPPPERRPVLSVVEGGAAVAQADA
jgi:FlaA1/EpsC-like NDP-sugar epimerase